MYNLLNFDKYLFEKNQIKKNKIGKIIIIFGPPGSGKGTLSKKISKETGILHVSTGNLLRSSKEPKIQQLMSSGKLVPDKYIIKEIKKIFKNKDLSKGIIIDGFPRTISQSKKLDSMLGKMGLGLSYSIYLKIEKDEAIKRILKRDEGRKDDESKEIIEERFKEYNIKTLPLVEYYNKSRKTIILNGMESIEKNYKKIIKKLL